jgi:DNA-binding NtrC family response regulator
MAGQVSMTVLVIDDDPQIRASVGKFLVARGHTVIEAASGEKGLEVIQKTPVDIVITDVRMPGIDGFEVLRQVKELSPETEVIVITAINESQNAFRAMHEGAFDFFNKPFKIENLNAAIQRTVRYQILQKDRNRVQARLDRLDARERAQSGLSAIIGESQAMQNVRKQIRMVSEADNTTVLITGETGTGKELVAKAVHYESARVGPFIPVNCSAIPQGLFESEFFGHVKGAFTDARETRKGHFELAHGGTLFLDEIGDMTPDMQVRLLRTLEERVVRPVGSSKEIPVDVRVVSATNRDLPKAVSQGMFREDLFYRLNVFTIRVPPLRERPEDIVLLARHFLSQFAQELRKSVQGFSPDAEEWLKAQPIPGNVRMLKNVIERAVLCCNGVVMPEDLVFEAEWNEAEVAISDAQATDIASVVQKLPKDMIHLPAFEQALVREALHRMNGNQSHAAQMLGITRMALRNRMKRFGLL